MPSKSFSTSFPLPKFPGTSLESKKIHKRPISSSSYQRNSPCERTPSQIPSRSTSFSRRPPKPLLISQACRASRDEFLIRSQPAASRCLTSWPRQLTATSQSRKDPWARRGIIQSHGSRTLQKGLNFQMIILNLELIESPSDKKIKYNEPVTQFPRTSPQPSFSKEQPLRRSCPTTPSTTTSLETQTTNLKTWVKLTWRTRLLISKQRWRRSSRSHSSQVLSTRIPLCRRRTGLERMMMRVWPSFAQIQCETQDLSAKKNSKSQKPLFWRPLKSCVWLTK